MLTVEGIIRELDDIEKSIEWVEDRMGTTSNPCEAGRCDTIHDLLSNYRSIILKTKVDL